jgi:excisionase family DNA binding protein
MPTHAGYLTVPQCAALLGVSVAAVQSAIRRGRLRAAMTTHGNAMYLVTPDDLATYQRYRRAGKYAPQHDLTFLEE